LKGIFFSKLIYIMLVGSQIVKPLPHKLFGKLNNPRTVLGQKLIKVGINQLKNHIQDMNKPHHSPLEK
jgi:hypothetical protein